MVHAFKLVVARLASKIIVGNKRVFEEFFAKFGVQGGEGKKSRRRKRRSNRSLYHSWERSDRAGIRGGPLSSSDNKLGSSLCVNCLDEESFDTDSESSCSVDENDSSGRRSGSCSRNTNDSSLDDESDYRKEVNRYMKGEEKQHIGENTDGDNR